MNAAFKKLIGICMIWIILLSSISLGSTEPTDQVIIDSNSNLPDGWDYAKPNFALLNAQNIKFINFANFEPTQDLTIIFNSPDWLAQLSNDQWKQITQAQIQRHIALIPDVSRLNQDSLAAALRQNNLLNAATTLLTIEGTRIVNNNLVSPGNHTLPLSQFNFDNVEEIIVLNNGFVIRLSDRRVQVIGDFTDVSPVVNQGTGTLDAISIHGHQFNVDQLEALVDAQGRRYYQIDTDRFGAVRIYPHQEGMNVITTDNDRTVYGAHVQTGEVKGLSYGATVFDGGSFGLSLDGEKVSFNGVRTDLEVTYGGKTDKFSGEFSASYLNQNFIDVSLTSKGSYAITQEYGSLWNTDGRTTILSSEFDNALDLRTLNGQKKDIQQKLDTEKDPVILAQLRQQMLDVNKRIEVEYNKLTDSGKINIVYSEKDDIVAIGVYRYESDLQTGNMNYIEGLNEAGIVSTENSYKGMFPIKDFRIDTFKDFDEKTDIVMIGTDVMIFEGQGENRKPVLVDGKNLRFTILASKQSGKMSINVDKDSILSLGILRDGAGRLKAGFTVIPPNFGVVPISEKEGVLKSLFLDSDVIYVATDKALSVSDGVDLANAVTALRADKAKALATIKALIAVGSEDLDKALQGFYSDLANSKYAELNALFDKLKKASPNDKIAVESEIRDYLRNNRDIRVEDLNTFRNSLLQKYNVIKIQNNYQSTIDEYNRLINLGSTELTVELADVQAKLLELRQPLSQESQTLLNRLVTATLNKDIQEFERISTEANTNELKNFAIREIGSIYQDRGDYQKAIEKFREIGATQAIQRILEIDAQNKARIAINAVLQTSISNREVFTGKEDEIASLLRAQGFSDSIIKTALDKVKDDLLRSEAKSLEALGKADAARVIYNKLNYERETSRSLNDLSKSYYSTGDFNTAEDYALRALSTRYSETGYDITKNDIYLLSDLGIAYSANKKYEQALGEYTRAQSFLGRVENGEIIIYSEGDDRSRDLDQFLSLRNSEAGALNNLGRKSEAIDVYGQVIEVADEFTSTWINAKLGRAETYLDKQKDVLDLLSQEDKLNDYQRQRANNIAGTYHLNIYRQLVIDQQAGKLVNADDFSKQVRDAIGYFERSDTSDALVFAAGVVASLGRNVRRNSDADDLYDRAKEKFKGNAKEEKKIYAASSAYYAQTLRGSQSAQDFHKLLSLDPKNSENVASAVQASLYLNQNGYFDGAEQIVSTVHSLDTLSDKDKAVVTNIYAGIRKDSLRRQVLLGESVDWSAARQEGLIKQEDVTALWQLQSKLNSDVEALINDFDGSPEAISKFRHAAPTVQKQFLERYRFAQRLDGFTLQDRLTNLQRVGEYSLQDAEQQDLIRGEIKTEADGWRESADLLKQTVGDGRVENEGHFTSQAGEAVAIGVRMKNTEEALFLMRLQSWSRLSGDERDRIVDEYKEKFDTFSEDRSKVYQEIGSYNSWRNNGRFTMVGGVNDGLVAVGQSKYTNAQMDQAFLRDVALAKLNEDAAVGAASYLLQLQRRESTDLTQELGKLRNTLEIVKTDSEREIIRQQISGIETKIKNLAPEIASRDSFVRTTSGALDAFVAESDDLNRVKNSLEDSSRARWYRATIGAALATGDYVFTKVSNVAKSVLPVVQTTQEEAYAKHFTLQQDVNQQTSKLINHIAANTESLDEFNAAVQAITRAAVLGSDQGLSAEHRSLLYTAELSGAENKQPGEVTFDDIKKGLESMASSRNIGALTSLFTNGVTDSRARIDLEIRAAAIGALAERKERAATFDQVHGFQITELGKWIDFTGNIGRIMRSDAKVHSIPYLTPLVWAAEGLGYDTSNVPGVQQIGNGETRKVRETFTQDFQTLVNLMNDPNARASLVHALERGAVGDRAFQLGAINQWAQSYVNEQQNARERDLIRLGATEQDLALSRENSDSTISELDRNVRLKSIADTALIDKNLHSAYNQFDQLAQAHTEFSAANQDIQNSWGYYFHTDINAVQDINNAVAGTTIAGVVSGFAGGLLTKASNAWHGLKVVDVVPPKVTWGQRFLNAGKMYKQNALFFLDPAEAAEEFVLEPLGESVFSLASKTKYTSFLEGQYERTISIISGRGQRTVVNENVHINRQSSVDINTNTNYGQTLTVQNNQGTWSVNRVTSIIGDSALVATNSQTGEIVRFGSTHELHAFVGTAGTITASDGRDITSEIGRRVQEIELNVNQMARDRDLSEIVEDANAAPFETSGWNFDSQEDTKKNIENVKDPENNGYKVYAAQLNSQHAAVTVERAKARASSAQIEYERARESGDAAALTAAQDNLRQSEQEWQQAIEQGQAAAELYYETVKQNAKNAIADVESGSRSLVSRSIQSLSEYLGLTSTPDVADLQSTINQADAAIARARQERTVQEADITQRQLQRAEADIDAAEDYNAGDAALQLLHEIRDQRRQKLLEQQVQALQESIEANTQLRQALEDNLDRASPEEAVQIQSTIDKIYEENARAASDIKNKNNALKAIDVAKDIYDKQITTTNDKAQELRLQRAAELDRQARDADLQAKQISDRFSVMDEASREQFGQQMMQEWAQLRQRADDLHTQLNVLNARIAANEIMSMANPDVRTEMMQDSFIPQSEKVKLVEEMRQNDEIFGVEAEVQAEIERLNNIDEEVLDLGQDLEKRVDEALAGQDESYKEDVKIKMKLDKKISELEQRAERAFASYLETRSDADIINYEYAISQLNKHNSHIADIKARNINLDAQEQLGEDIALSDRISNVQQQILATRAAIIVKVAELKIATDQGDVVRVSQFQQEIQLLQTSLSSLESQLTNLDVQRERLVVQEQTNVQEQQQLPTLDQVVDEVYAQERASRSQILKFRGSDVQVTYSADTYGNVVIKTAHIVVTNQDGTTEFGAAINSNSFVALKYYLERSIGIIKDVLPGMTLTEFERHFEVTPDGRVVMDDEAFEAFKQKVRLDDDQQAVDLVESKLQEQDPSVTCRVGSLSCRGPIPQGLRESVLAFTPQDLEDRMTKFVPNIKPERKAAFAELIQSPGFSKLVFEQRTEKGQQEARRILYSLAVANIQTLKTLSLGIQQRFPSLTTEITDYARAVTEVDGRYSLEQELGRGQFGVVYRAFDTFTGDQVAIKIPLPDLSDKQIRTFDDEARVLKDLKHKNIVASTPLDSDKQYIVQEYLDGDSLLGHFQSQYNIEFNDVRPFAQKVPLTAIADVFVQLADAIIYLQENQLLHGDLKPENIVVLPDGTVKLIDFGFARTFDRIRPDRQSIGYAAPELIFTQSFRKLRETNQFDPFKLDVFSFSATCYKLFVGHVPDVGLDRPDTLSKSPRSDISKPLSNRYLEIDPEASGFNVDFENEYLSEVDIDSLAEDMIQQGIPSDLANMIAMGLSADPRDRPSAEQFREAFEKYATTGVQAQVSSGVGTQEDVTKIDEAFEQETSSLPSISVTGENVVDINQLFEEQTGRVPGPNERQVMQAIQEEAVCKD